MSSFTTAPLLSQSQTAALGSLERQRSLTRLLIQMQASGKIWVDPRLEQTGEGDRYAVALQKAMLDLCQRPEHYTIEGLFDQFNQALRQSCNHHETPFACSTQFHPRV